MNAYLAQILEPMQQHVMHVLILPSINASPMLAICAGRGRLVRFRLFLCFWCDTSLSRSPRHGLLVHGDVTRHAWMRGSFVSRVVELLPERVTTIHKLLEQSLEQYVGIQVHLGKTQV